MVHSDSRHHLWVNTRSDTQVRCQMFECMLMSRIRAGFLWVKHGISRYQLCCSLQVIRILSVNAHNTTIAMSSISFITLIDQCSCQSQCRQTTPVPDKCYKVWVGVHVEFDGHLTQSRSFWRWSPQPIT